MSADITYFVLFCILNTLFAVLISPFFISLIKKVKAYCQGRRGPSLFQTYYNLFKLLKKETVYSNKSSFIMRIAPYINLIFTITAGICVPLIFIPNTNFFVGSVILFLYLLGMAKFFMAVAGLDGASTFGGMGSSREMTISSIIEPVIILIFVAFAYVLHTTDIHQMITVSSNIGGILFVKPALFPLLIALFIVLIVESMRVPIDNPETHLELTMVHEAMILEQSGKNLFMMELSSAIKQTILMAVLINIFFPFGFAKTLTFSSALIAMVWFFLKSCILCIVIGLFESSFAKLRLFRVPHFFVLAFFLSILTIIFEVFA